MQVLTKMITPTYTRSVTAIIYWLPRIKRWGRIGLILSFCALFWLGLCRTLQWRKIWSPRCIILCSVFYFTAYTEDTASEVILAGGTTKASDPFDIGAGHINPIKAMDPGLVYDMKTSDHIIFLCNLGYTQYQISLIVQPGTDTTCPCSYTGTSNLNYPAIVVSNLQETTTLRRTVRNVGWNRNALYFARTVDPDGVGVYIWPRVMVFPWFREEVTYYVTLRPRKISRGRYDFGEIVWSDGFHIVRIPLAVCVNNTDGTVTDSSTSYWAAAAHMSSSLQRLHSRIWICMTVGNLNQWPCLNKNFLYAHDIMGKAKQIKRVFFLKPHSTKFFINKKL